MKSRLNRISFDWDNESSLHILKVVILRSSRNSIEEEKNQRVIVSLISFKFPEVDTSTMLQQFKTLGREALKYAKFFSCLCEMRSISL